MFVPETLMAALQELTAEYDARQGGSGIPGRTRPTCSTNYVGRPTPLYFAERWTEKLGGAKIYLKREDLLHTGAHKINNALGQILLAQRLGKKRIIAETGAGQHGVATATVCARFGMECVDLHGRGRHGAAGAQRRPHAACSAPKSAPSPPARRRSRRPSTKPCATG